MDSKDADDKYLALALSLAKRAGEIIKERVHDPNKKGVCEKSSSVDLVTETDKECERIIIDGIKEVYPSHHFIAEESHDGDFTLTDEPTWLIDPIDGTTNFVHGLPFVCVSIAVAVGRRVRVGVVHAPLLDETFTAITGRGAFLNEAQALRVSTADSLAQSIVLMEVGYDRSEEGVEAVSGRLAGLLRAGVQSVRFYGSCALNLCEVAAGRAQAYFEGRDAVRGPKAWDSAAGALIVTEAGGVLHDPDGGEFSMFSGRVFAACNELVARATLDIVRRVRIAPAAL